MKPSRRSSTGSPARLRCRSMPSMDRPARYTTRDIHAERPGGSIGISGCNGLHVPRAPRDPSWPRAATQAQGRRTCPRPVGGHGTPVCGHGTPVCGHGTPVCGHGTSVCRAAPWLRAPAGLRARHVSCAGRDQSAEADDLGRARCPSRRRASPSPHGRAWPHGADRRLACRSLPAGNRALGLPPQARAARKAAYRPAGHAPP